MMMALFSFPKFKHGFSITVLVLVVIFGLLNCASHFAHGRKREGYVRLNTRFANLLGTIERIEYEGFREYPFDKYPESYNVNAEYYHAFRGLPYAESPRWKVIV